MSSSASATILEDFHATASLEAWPALMTPDEVALVLRLQGADSRQQIQRHRVKGLRAVIVGKKLMFRSCDVLEYIARLPTR